MKCIITHFQFDVSNSVSIRIQAEKIEDAIEIFKVVFGDMLLRQVLRIYNIDIH